MVSYFPASWASLLKRDVFGRAKEKIAAFLDDERKVAVVYPPEQSLFSALHLCPSDAVKVVIVGQDPYHGEGEAHGLAFSVREGVKCPPSLQNILKEVISDVGKTTLPGTDLSHWAQQGVLLLNTTLTVRKDSPMSHVGKGWEEITTEIIRAISLMDRPIVFMLWGKHAQQFVPLISHPKHLVLTAPHPSPLSAHRGFLGCKHFSKANAWLEKNGEGKIEW